MRYTSLTVFRCITSAVEAVLNLTPKVLQEAIADINPDDIESISFLTGAAAAAMYGSNAANGAIVVTTKRGQIGKLSATFSSSMEFMNPFVLPKFPESVWNRYTGRCGRFSHIKLGA